MSIMMKELLEAKEAIANASENISVIEKIAALVKARNITKICTVARGTSDNAATYFKYVCELKYGFSVSKVVHSVITIHNSEIDFDDTLVVAISQSGRSYDTQAVMEKAKKYNSVTVAVTNDVSSPLATLCDFHLFLNTGEEKSVAATKTFTAQLTNLYLLAQGLSKNKETVDLAAIANKVDSFVKENSEELRLLAEKNKDINNIVLLSRGEFFSIAKEFSLKMMETCYKFSRPFSTASFMHGPLAVLGENSIVMLLAPDNVFKEGFIEDAKKIKTTGASLFTFSGINEILELADNKFEIKADSSLESILLYTVSLQCFVAYLSEAVGNNPDTPRNLHKVTLTL